MPSDMVVDLLGVRYTGGMLLQLMIFVMFVLSSHTIMMVRGGVLDLMLCQLPMP